MLKATGVPLMIIWGCDNDDKDNEVLPRCSQAAAGERCLLAQRPKRTTRPSWRPARRTATA